MPDQARVCQNHAATPSRRRDIRWLWQTLLLAVLGAVVVAWNLLIRG